VKPESAVTAVSDLLEQGILLCGRWEELAAQQLAALECRDVEAFSVAQASQMHLAEQFYALERSLGQAARAAWRAPSSGAVQGLPGNESTALQARRLQFEAVAQRVFVANARNAKALSLLMLLGATFEPLTPGYQAAYNRQGTLQAGRRALATTIEREG